MLAKNIILFDMDNTLVSADTMDLWSEYLESKGLMTEEEKKIRRKFNQDYHARKLDVVANFKFESTLINKIPVSLQHSWREEFFREYVQPKISQKGLTLIKDYKNNAENIILLITATLSFIASPVAHYAEVHDFIATEIEIENKIYTGKILGSPCLGDGKLEKFKRWLSANHIVPAYTVLYSDSSNDLPLFHFVDKPVATDPDKHLAKIAEEKNWDCMSLID